MPVFADYYFLTSIFADYHPFCPPAVPRSCRKMSRDKKDLHYIFSITLNNILQYPCNSEDTMGSSIQLGLAW